MDKSTVGSVKLSVDCEVITICELTPDGLMPTSRGDGDLRDKQPTELYTCKHLPPKNITESTLLSMWINTHQAMFISTGIAATCVNHIASLIENDTELETMHDWVDLATACRLSSAAYTSLPHLTKELYEAYVRRSMMEVHPGFSGVSNREAIAMELALRRLATAHLAQADRNRALAVKILPEVRRIQDADREWWRYHGNAMRKYVSNPTSLARLDYRKQKEAGSGDVDFSEYRERILRQDEAIDDYDIYFAVRRNPKLVFDDYRASLNTALQRSSSYIESKGILAEYRSKGEKALHSAIDYFEKMS